MRHLPALLSAAGMLAIATTGVAQTAPGFGFHYIEAEQAAGRQLFDEHCTVCHAPKRGQAFGPSLNGVLGRPAGSVSGFPYSEALKKSGLVWTEDNLRKWVGDAAATVPHTLMPHVSFSDPAEQVYVVEYLKTLKGRAAR
jgi:cytochrome c